ncbi:MAG: WGR domain-containing protein [Phycisphaerales bacterium]
MEYHEAWSDGKTIVEHWGRVGDRGETRKHRLGWRKNAAAQINKLLKKPRQNGYIEIDAVDHKILIIEYAIAAEPRLGTSADLAKRHAVEDLMNEFLGWTGLGNCDGGSIGSGTMEICCLVVDYEAAERAVAKHLSETPFSDFTRIYRED